MTPQEIERTSELLLSLAGEHSVVVVEHVMRIITSLCHRVVVLNQGRLLAEGAPADVLADEGVREAYLGRGFVSA